MERSPTRGASPDRSPHARLGSIQFLRAVAAIGVAYAHSIDVQMRYTHSFQQDFFHWQNFGAFGVDIFFVISGFIICYAAGRYKGRRDGWFFIVHRFQRINPVYYLATLPILFIKGYRWFNHHPVQLSLQNVLKSILILPFADKACWTNALLVAGWTLSFEWFFYLLFLAAILCRVQKKAGFLWMASAILCIGGYILPAGGDYRLHFITNPLILEFMIGVALYTCYTKWKLPNRVALILIIAGAGICLGEIIQGFGNISEWPYIINGELSFQRFLWWGIPAGLLVAGTLFLEKNGAIDFMGRHRLINLLGDASYSIYLVNTIVFGSLIAFYDRFGFFLPPDLGIFVHWLLAVAISVFFYKWVEAPLLKWMRRRFPAGR